MNHGRAGAAYRRTPPRIPGWSLVSLLLACNQTGTELSPRRADAGAATGPTFHADVEPILAKHCQGCHVPGGLAPFALTRFEDARAQAPAIALETTARRMPPWGAQTSAECAPPHPYQRDMRLSDEEIATIARWASAGAPEGSPRSSPVHVAARADALPNATMELSPRAPFSPPEGRDSYRCFVMDPNLPNGGWVTGVHVVPDNRRIVHHAMVYTDPGGVSSASADDSGGFDCAPTGAPGVISNPQSLLLDVWTPGVEPIDLPPGVGMRIAPGAKIILAMHYSPSPRRERADASRVQLRLTHDKPKYVLVTTGIGNFSSRLSGGDGLLPGPEDPGGSVVFRVPAGARDHVEQMQLTVGDVGTPVRLYGVMAHMHLAGKEMKVSLYDPSSDRDTCLLQERWDFHWQRMYAYDAPLDALPLMVPGQKIRLRCTYDNSTDNRRLAAELAARRMQPQDLGLGDGTLDEMCLFVPQLLFENPE